MIWQVYCEIATEMRGDGGRLAVSELAGARL
jgi:hypothetical protein